MCNNSNIDKMHSQNHGLTSDLKRIRSEKLDLDVLNTDVADYTNEQCCDVTVHLFMFRGEKRLPT